MFKSMENHCFVNVNYFLSMFMPVTQYPKSSMN